MTAVPRPRCGNDPRAQLTDGDRQAIADFRAYLTRRAQEKTMDEQGHLDASRAVLAKHLVDTPQARTALEAFEAAVRANERAGTTRAAVLREGAAALMSADLGPRPGHTDDYRAGWDDATHRAASQLRMRADEASR